MSGGLFRHWSVIRALMVALAVIGSGLDTIPAPILAAAGIGEPVAEGSNATDTEDERDETPDDSTDLTWLMVQFATRGEKRLTRGHPIEFPSPSHRESERTPLNPTTSVVARVSLPIRLCRFTC